jgi:hypothetical protein
LEEFNSGEAFWGVHGAMYRKRIRQVRLGLRSSRSAFKWVQ